MAVYRSEAQANQGWRIEWMILQKVKKSNRVVTSTRYDGRYRIQAKQLNP